MVYPASSQVTQVSGSMCDTSDYSCCFRETLISVSFRWHITFISIKFDENHVNSRHFKKFTANWKNRGIHSFRYFVNFYWPCNVVQMYRYTCLQGISPSGRFALSTFHHQVILARSGWFTLKILCTACPKRTSQRWWIECRRRKKHLLRNPADIGLTACFIGSQDLVSVSL